MNIAELRRRKEATNDRLLPITTTDLRLPTETATVSPELPKEEVHPTMYHQASAWRCKR